MKKLLNEWRKYLEEEMNPAMKQSWIKAGKPQQGTNKWSMWYNGQRKVDMANAQKQQQPASPQKQKQQQQQQQQQQQNVPSVEKYYNFWKNKPIDQIKSQMSTMIKARGKGGLTPSGENQLKAMQAVLKKAQAGRKQASNKPAEGVTGAELVKRGIWSKSRCPDCQYGIENGVPFISKNGKKKALKGRQAKQVQQALAKLK